MADFICMCLNVTLCLTLLAIGVLAVETIWRTVRKIIFGNQEEKR